MVIINDNGSRLTESQVADLESRIGLPLPDDYRRFLLENNGGSPTPDVIKVNGIQGSETDLGVFFGIDRSIESENIEWNLHVMSDRVGRPLMPIADDSGGNVFFLSLSGHDRNSIYYHYFWGPGADGELYLVATSFTSFLEKIRQLEN
jgi:hypothetical protein